MSTILLHGFIITALFELFLYVQFEVAKVFNFGMRNILEI